MKSVKTLAQATKLAAMQGATLDVGGRLINAQGAKLSVVRPAPKPAQPEPPAEPVAPPAPAAGDQLAQIVREQSQVLAALVDRLQTPALPSQPAPQPRMRPVSFTVVRDDDGYITEILPRY